MESAPSNYVLVAMAASGEVFFVRDPDGDLLLISPEAAGGVEHVDESVLARAVTDHGFQRVDQHFDTLKALDAERQRRAGLDATVEVNVDQFDRDDLERLLRIASRWARRGEISRARRLAHALLAAPILMQDRSLYDDVLKQLNALDRAPTVELVAAPDPMRAAARERMALDA